MAVVPYAVAWKFYNENGKGIAMPGSCLWQAIQSNMTGVLTPRTKKINQGQGSPDSWSMRLFDCWELWRLPESAMLSGWKRLIMTEGMSFPTPGNLSCPIPFVLVGMMVAVTEKATENAVVRVGRVSV